MITFFKLVGIVFVMTLIIPLYIAGGTASWKAGFAAWWSYIRIMGAFVLICGGFGMAMAFAEHGWAAFDFLSH